jgi:hypothetical protein
MTGRFLAVILAGACAVSMACGCDGGGRAAVPNPIPDPKREIERAKDGVQKANEAAAKRTDDALDRAMQGEVVERGQPRPR